MQDIHQLFMSSYYAHNNNGLLPENVFGLPPLCHTDFVFDAAFTVPYDTTSIVPFSLETPTAPPMPTTFTVPYDTTFTVPYDTTSIVPFSLETPTAPPMPNIFADKIEPVISNNHAKTTITSKMDESDEQYGIKLKDVDSEEVKQIM